MSKDEASWTRIIENMWPHSDKDWIYNFITKDDKLSFFLYRVSFSYKKTFANWTESQLFSKGSKE